jgi:hypothetical protein
MNPFAPRFAFHRDGHGSLKVFVFAGLIGKRPNKKVRVLFPIAARLRLCCDRKHNRGN